MIIYFLFVISGSQIELQDDYESNPNFYHRVLSPGLVSMHWRFLGSEEVEIAVKAKTLSWVGL